MAATGLTFQVTITATGSTYDISSDDIYIVLASGTGSKIFFNTGASQLTQIIVDENPASIQTSSQMLIAVTDSTSSATFYLNADKVRQVLTNGTGAKIYFDDGGTEDRIFTVTESRSTVRTLIAGQVAESTGEFVTLAGSNTASSTNTWSGAQTFSHATTPVKTDIVVERTGAAGVTIDGVLVKDGGAVFADGASIEVDIVNEATSTAGVTVDGALIKDAAFDTNVVAAGVTLSGTTLAADGTDAAIPITITPKGVAGVQSVAGTAAVPAYSFTGQADMGAYKSSATEYAISASGTFVARFSTAEGIAATGLNTTPIEEVTPNTAKFTTQGIFGTASEGNGLMTLKSKAATKVFAGGATEVIAVQVPSGALIVSCQLRNNTILIGAGAATYSAAYSTGATQAISAGTAFAKNTKVNTFFNVNAATAITTGLTDVTLTPDAGTLDTGTVEAVVYYYELTSMTNAA